MGPGPHVTRDVRLPHWRCGAPDHPRDMGPRASRWRYTVHPPARRATALFRKLRQHDAETRHMWTSASALTREGIVSRPEGTRSYLLGPVVFELGLAAARRFDPRAACERTLRRLRDRTGDTVFLNFRSGLDTVCIERLDGDAAPKALLVDVGARRSMVATAGGVAMLMALPPVERRRVTRARPARAASGRCAACTWQPARRSRPRAPAARQAPPPTPSQGCCDHEPVSEADRPCGPACDRPVARRPVEVQPRRPR